MDDFVTKKNFQAFRKWFWKERGIVGAGVFSQGGGNMGRGAATSPLRKNPEPLITHKMPILSAPPRIPCYDSRSDIRYFRILLSIFPELPESTALPAWISGVFFYPAGVLFERAGLLFERAGVLFERAGVLFERAGIHYYCGVIRFYHTGIGVSC